MSKEKSAETKQLTVGQILKNRRAELGLNLRDIEVATKIRGKYLTQLERDDHHLPNDVYTRGFVQTYANFMGLSGRTLARQYAEERGDVIRAAAARLKPVKTPKIVLTPQFIAVLAAATVLGGIALYLMWQFRALAAPPRLEVTRPAADQAVQTNILEVKGKTSSGADVFINESPILSDPDGNFSDKLALQDGINTIRITAKNRLGKSTTITRNVLAQIGKPQLAEIPATVFDGIGVVVTTGDAAAALAVTVDGVERFKGTMLPGTTQAFKGTGKIIISTNNAGTTHLTVTNSNVAGKALGALGRQGEEKNNLEFTKDTQFP